MPKVKEPKDQRITIRYTQTECKRLEEEATLYQMDVSTYCHDKSLKGKERRNYYRRNMNTKLVEITNATNAIYDYIARVEGDVVPKKDLLPLVDKVKKGCEAMWKH